MSFDTSAITGQIETFLQSAKRLETDLALEREKNQKLAKEYLEVRGKLEKAVRLLQSHLQHRDQMIHQLSTAVKEHQNSQTKLMQRNQEIESTDRKIREELNQYKSAWAEVLARESEARNVLSEGEKLKRLCQDQRQQLEKIQRELTEARNRADGSTRHIETYQRELQSALVRLQSSEAKFNQLNREYQVMATQKRSTDEEISRLETSMRERFKWELATECEKIRAELEKESALDRERFREMTRRTAAAEHEKSLKEERLRQRELEEESNELKERIRKLQMDGKAEFELLRQKLSAAQQTLQAANLRHEEESELKANQLAQALDRAERSERIHLHNQEALGEMRTRISEQDKAMNLLKLEKQQVQTVSEQARKSLTKSMLVEKLRYEAEIDRLKSMLEQSLVESRERADLIIERVDGEITEEILMAHPVFNARPGSDPKTPEESSPLS